MYAKPRQAGAFQRELKGWGSLVTGDHLVGTKEQMQGLTDDQDALTIKDVYSGLKHCYTLPLKTKEDAYDAMQNFTEGRMVSQWYSDRSGELLEASKLLCFPRDASLQGTPGNNAIAERKKTHY